MNLIRDNWVRSMLGDVIVPSKDKVDPRAFPNQPYVGLEHVEADTMRLLGHGHGADVESTKSTFRKRDVLYGKLRPYLNKVVQPDFDGICSTDFLVFRESKHLDPDYLAQYLNQAWIADAAAQASRGVQLPRVNWEFLANLPVSFPHDKSEQRAIASLLRSIRERQSDAQEHLAAAKRAVGRLRHSVMAAACSGRLTAQWRAEHPHEAQAPPGPPLSRAGASHASPGDNTSDFVDIPDTWAWWTIESAFRDVIDYRGRTPPHSEQGPIPHIRTTQIRNGRINWAAVDRFVTKSIYDQYMTRGIPHVGDILFTMEAPLGDVGIVDRHEDFSIAQRILLFRPGRCATTEYLAIALQSDPVQHAIQNRATGSGVHGIAYKRLRSVELPIPPAAEQAAIVGRTNELIDLSESLANRIEFVARITRRYSQSVLQKVFEQEA